MNPYINAIKDIMWYATEDYSVEDKLLAAIELAKECAEGLIEYLKN